MELVLLFCAFLFFSSMVFNLLKKSYNSKLKLPPGPKQLPIIGNMHQLYGGLIHHVLRDLARKYGPLMHLQIGEVSTIVVSSPEVAQEVFRTKDILVSQRPSNLIALKVISYDFKDIIFSRYGNYWRQLRKICVMELLSPKRVQTFRSIREEEVFNLITSLSSQKGTIVNLSKMIFSLTYSITARAAFGKRNRYQEKFIHLVEENIKLAEGFSIADMYPSIKLLQLISGMRYKLQRTHKQIDEILESILNEHKENNNKPNHPSGEAKEDLVDILLNIQDGVYFERPLTDTSIKAVIYDIFSAGSETSSTTADWAMSEMIKHPEVIKRAQEEVRTVFSEKGNVDESGLHELRYLQAVIKETLRLHPSAPLLIPRECAEQCEIHGYQIPAKTRVIFNAWAIARNPHYWTEPEKFDPNRFLDSEVDYKGNNFEFIPFGAGRRMCPGISFALANLELPLAQLLFHFDWKLLDQMKEEELDMTEAVGAASKRAKDLYVNPIPYTGSSVNESIRN